MGGGEGKPGGLVLGLAPRGPTPTHLAALPLHLPPSTFQTWKPLHTHKLNNKIIWKAYSDCKVSLVVKPRETLMSLKVLRGVAEVSNEAGGGEGKPGGLVLGLTPRGPTPTHLAFLPLHPPPSTYQTWKPLPPPYDRSSLTIVSLACTTRLTLQAE